MPRTKDKKVPGLTFRIQVTPLLRGRPFSAVEPIEFEWDQTFAIEWHEGHRATTLGFALEEVRRKVRQALQLRDRTRRA